VVAVFLILASLCLVVASNNLAICLLHKANIIAEHNDCSKTVLVTAACNYSLSLWHNTSEKHMKPRSVAYIFCSDTFICKHWTWQCCEECSFGYWSADSCIPKTAPKKLGFEESSRGLVLTSSSLQGGAPVMANVNMAVTRPCLCMLLYANHGMLLPNLLSQTIAVIPLPQPPTDPYLGSMNPWVCHSNLLCITAIAPGWPEKKNKKKLKIEC